MTFQRFCSELAKEERGAVEVPIGQVRELMRRTFLRLRVMRTCEVQALMESARTAGKSDTTPKRKRSKKKR